MAITSLVEQSDVTDYKGWGSNAARNAWIDEALQSVSARFMKALNGRQIIKAAQTEYFTVRPNESQTFQLAAYPVDSGETITVSNDSLRAFGSGTELAAANWHIDDTLGILVIDGTGLDSGFMSLKVAYTGGIGAAASNIKTDFPDITQAIVIQIAFEYESRNRVGQDSVQGPDGSISVYSPQEWLPVVREVIDRYKLKVL